MFGKIFAAIQDLMGAARIGQSSVVLSREAPNCLAEEKQAEAREPRVAAVRILRFVVERIRYFVAAVVGQMRDSAVAGMTVGSGTVFD